MELTKAEELVVKHFGAKHGRKLYVILGLGFINWLAGTAFGHYLEIPAQSPQDTGQAKLWLEPFRYNVKTNDPDQINSLLISALRASYKEETGQVPDTEFTKAITAKANKVRLDYMALFPDLED